MESKIEEDTVRERQGNQNQLELVTEIVRKKDGGKVEELGDSDCKRKMRRDRKFKNQETRTVRKR